MSLSIICVMVAEMTYEFEWGNVYCCLLVNYRVNYVLNEQNFSDVYIHVYFVQDEIVGEFT